MATATWCAFVRQWVIGDNCGCLLLLLTQAASDSAACAVFHIANLDNQKLLFYGTVVVV